MSDDSVAGLAEQVAAAPSSPSKQLARAQSRDNVRQALNQLSDRDREFIVMRHLEQLSIKEIAAVTGVTVGTVKSRLFRGMDQLHQLLDDRSFGAQT